MNSQWKQAALPGVPPESPIETLLLSIQAQHVRRIFLGVKRYEIRKRLPRRELRRVYIWESGGGGIVGSFDIRQIIEDRIANLWKRVGEAATTRERFFGYFGDVPVGFAIEIADVVKFPKPIASAELNSRGFALTPPQSYTLLKPHDSLLKFLEDCRKSAVDSTTRLVSLRPISAHERTDFVKLVEREVANNYEDITSAFAHAALRSHDQGVDEHGFMTLRKEVLSVVAPTGDTIGFTTLTHKRGRSIKSGPTLLFPNARNTGYGQGVRLAIEQRAVKLGYTKVYCTCPDSALPVVKYLLKSGYSIEAHMVSHYSSEHGELVFGKVLTDPAILPAYPIIRSQSACARVVQLREFRTSVAARITEELFCGAWGSIQRGFGLDFVRDCLRQTSVLSYEEKPKRALCLKSAKNCVGIGVLIPKRGSIVKCLVFARTAHRPSIKRLLEAIEHEAISLHPRKIFFVHPVMDHMIVELLLRANYAPEGLLRGPYHPKIDGIVLSKLLEQG